MLQNDSQSIGDKEEIAEIVGENFLKVPNEYLLSFELYRRLLGFDIYLDTNLNQDNSAAIQYKKAHEGVNLLGCVSSKNGCSYFSAKKESVVNINQIDNEDNIKLNVITTWNFYF